jgi:hypothetical protein
VWVDWLLGELPADEERGLEEHLFECAACAARAESVQRIANAVRDAVRRAAVGGNMNHAFLDRARSDGLTLREYRLTSGETVPCQAGPEDLVVVRLTAGFGGARDLRLDVELTDLERGESMPLATREVAADRELGEVVLVFPGEVVRSFPRSRWRMGLRAESSSGPVDLGPFILDHTP